MPTRDIDPFPRRARGEATNLLRACAVAAVATASMALASGTAFAATGGTSAPSGDQQTTAASQPSGGAAAQPPKKHRKKHRSRKASHHIKLPKELKKIAMCESGGNPRAVSPSGRYRGKYQFDMETWRSVGGKGDPAKAPEWYQDKLALKLYRERGTAPWPNCA
jgi:soluble lytic murein transglycosylase-like protein